MILSRLFNRPSGLITPSWTRPELVTGASQSTSSGMSVNPETSKQVSTAYRCANLISDDIAKLPLQLFTKNGDNIARVDPDPVLNNMAYVIERKPNRYQAPFILKKAAIMWVLFWGNAYIWRPLTSPQEIYLIPPSIVRLEKSENGELYYLVAWPGLPPQAIPYIEILHLMINSTDGLGGKGVITYAKETLGRKLASSEAQGSFYDRGLLPAAVMQFAGDLSKEARDKVREQYSESMSGVENAGRLAVIDAKVERFDIVQMNPRDAQFLESIEATDLEIANFFGLPLYKLNQGKQSYNSNEQQNLDYLNSTLDPYLVQWEEAANLHWLSIREQVSGYYWKFERNAILRTDAKTRADYLQKKIMSGQMSPNEARAIEDISPYPGGDRRYMPVNMAVINESEE